MTEKKHILWVIPKNIFPVNDGAKRANYSLLKSMQILNENLDLFIFNEGELVRSFYQKEFFPQNIFLGTRENYRSQWHRICVLLKEFLLSPFSPMSANVFKSEENLKRIEKILLEKEYTAIVFDGLHPYLGFQKVIKRLGDKLKKVPTLIYRAHNVEADIWYTKASKTKNILLKTFLNFQGFLMARLEKNLLIDAKKVWTISEEDKDVFKNIIGEEKYSTIPVGMTFHLEKRITAGPQIHLMFLGKLDWDPNREGLKWFLDNIWPKVTNKNIKLSIAGSGDGEWLSKYRDLPQIEFLGLIDSVADLYNKSDYSIVPIQFGSGTRIKVIESVAFGVPVISTLMGVQGSGIKASEYIKAETVSEWVLVLNGLDSKELTNFPILQQRFFAQYSYDGISKLIKNDL